MAKADTLDSKKGFPIERIRIVDSILTVRLVDEKNINGDQNKQYGQYITIFLGLITAILAILGYKINKRAAILQKNQWHSQLFKQFYIDETYKEMRYILDFKPKDKFNQLLESLKPDSYDRISEQFFDYLNFFEYIASMCEAKQVDFNEVLNLFQYYLDILRKESFIRTEIKEEGFEFLFTFLKRLDNHVAEKA